MMYEIDHFRMFRGIAVFSPDVRGFSGRVVYEVSKHPLRREEFLVPS